MPINIAELSLERIRMVDGCCPLPTIIMNAWFKMPIQRCPQRSIQSPIRKNEHMYQLYAVGDSNFALFLLY